MEPRDSQQRQSRKSGGSFACNSPNCTGLLLGAVASVLVIGGIFLAFHNWDYNWLLVTAIGSLLVLIAAAVPFCSQDRSHGTHGKRGGHGIRMSENEPLPSAPPLSASYSVSQLSLNILPPMYPGCDELPPTPQSSPPNGVHVNHIMNINGQSYLLLPIVSPTGQSSPSNAPEVPNHRFPVTGLSCLQVELPSKREHQAEPSQADEASHRALENPTVPPTPQMTRDLLCESSVSDDTTSTMPTTNATAVNAQACALISNATAATSEQRCHDVTEDADIASADPGLDDSRGVESPGVLENNVVVSDQLPLIVIDPESDAVGDAEMADCDQSEMTASSSVNASPSGNDTDFLLTVGADTSDADDDDDVLVGATPPPSYDEVANEGGASVTGFSGAASFGTL
ncbi:unnamed protein product [Ixodes hexagonus]